MVHMGMYNHPFNQLTERKIFTGKFHARVIYSLPIGLNNEIKVMSKLAHAPSCETHPLTYNVVKYFPYTRLAHLTAIICK